MAIIFSSLFKTLNCLWSTHRQWCDNLCLIIVTGKGAQRLEKSKCHFHLQEGVRELQAGQPASIPGSMMEQLIWETVAGHAKGKKVIGNSQHELTNGKSCSNNLIAFYDEMTAVVDQRRAVTIFCLDIRKCFATVSLRIPLQNLMKYGLAEQTERWKPPKLPDPEGGNQWHEVQLEAGS